MTVENLVQWTTISNVIAVLAAVLLVLYWIHTFAILYHLIRFGIGTRPKQVSLLFFIGSTGLFFLLSMSVLLVVFTTT